MVLLAPKPNYLLIYLRQITYRIFMIMKRFVFFICFIFVSIASNAQENCNNGIDDDGDGKVDLNDTDCTCSTSTVSNLINNHNFEQYIECPNDFSQFNKTVNWFLPTNGTSDYINTCGFVPASATGAGIYPLPVANGKAVAGILIAQDYKEFIAICTNATLLAGVKYQVNLDIASSTSGRIVDTNPNIGEICNDGVLNAGAIDVSIYGKAACSPATPTDTNDFPIDWIPLGKASYIPSENWNQLSIVFTPSVNLNSIMLGGPKILPDTYIDEYNYRACYPYFYFDNVKLNTVAATGVKISATGIFCDNTLTLATDIDTAIGSGYSFQWYKDGVAIVGSTGSTINISHSTASIGNYQVKIANSNGCRISPFYNVAAFLDVPDFSFVQEPCFPGMASITVTTPADEFSFDNGETWTTVPLKENISPFYNPIKIMIKRNGCVSNVRYVALEYPAIETTNTPPDAIVVQPGCQTNGSITVTTPALEYSFDNGLTWTTNPAITDLPPDYYHYYRVKIKTLLGCITVAKTIVMQPYYLPEPTATQTNASCGIGGSITITTEAHAYSIDGGNTWSVSPVFTNLSAQGYNVSVKNELGCTSMIKTIFIGVDYLQKPQVTFTQPDCGTLGSITVTTPASLYSFDGGITWTLSNVATGLPSGFYHIRVKDAQNCESLTELVYLQSYIWDIDIDYTSVNSSCENNGSITVTTVAQEYSIDDGTSWQSSPFFDNLPADYYFIKVRNGMNCESDIQFVNLQDFTQISPDYLITDAGCAIFGSVTITTISDLYSFDNGVTWSTDNTLSNLSGNSNYTLVIKNNNCISQAAAVNFNSIFLPNPSVLDYNAFICDTHNDGIENINLVDYTSFIINNPASYNFFYFTSITDAQALNLNNSIQNFSNYEIENNDSKIFVAVVSFDNCLSVAEISFTFLASPIIDTIPDEVVLCQDKNVVVDAGADFYSYLWHNGATTSSITIDQPGNYHVTVGYDYGSQICSTTKNFNVILSSPATITTVTTQDFTDSDNTIEINTTGYGEYEYSIDDVHYQDSNVFTGLRSGIYTIYIRDKNNCGKITEEVFLLMYPRFFTPNNDGYNDTWKINFSQFESEIEVSIFDRHGKLLEVLKQSNSWDGTCNGQELPSDDYWFVVTRKNGKEFKNHFTLKR